MTAARTVACTVKKEPTRKDAERLYEALSDLVRVYQFRDRDTICCHDISVTQCYALEALVNSGPRTLNELAAQLFLDKSTASRVVSTLERKGYITRQTHPQDRRAILIDVTAGRRSRSLVFVRSRPTRLIPVDEIIAAAGFRPDLDILRELRLDLDPIVESPRALAPLIDPNIHSCGTVPPHGAEQLQHPERDFYIVGMKSYGRAPTFLLRTGYEQVRSVVAALTGDWESARRVELTLPETGVCCAPSSSSPSSCDAIAVPVTLHRKE